MRDSEPENTVYHEGSISISREKVTIEERPACLRERARNGKQKENGLTNAACGHYNVLRQMNSRCICAVRRGALSHGRVMGMRMRFPGYPSNREADERSKAIAQARRRQVG